ncbi:phage holin family protein [candidate division WOR-3 bacterium]|nr:phage holin family protein [candidate division WOR-3 bacterium]
MRLLIRWIIVALSLFVAAWLVPGIRVEGNAWLVFTAMAVILGLINAVIKPILTLLTCSLVILTLGLFVLVINALTLWLASSIAVNWFHVGFYVQDFWSAFLGALIVSIVTVILSAFIKEPVRHRRVAEGS